jgi:ABC-type sugar transport system substrate-binding protein
MIHAVDKRVLVVLLGTTEAEADAYQVLQKEAAAAAAVKAGVLLEILLAPGFDHLRVIRRRLGDTSAPPVDAVIVEPASFTSLGLLLRELKGRTGLVLLNIWAPEVDAHAKGWGKGIPFGTVSTDHKRAGQVQGRQIVTLLPSGGHVLCVTGPQRSSAAVERLEGMKLALPPEVILYETEAGGWTEGDGIIAFDNWYGLYKTRSFTVDVIAAQSDELAMGARSACRALAHAAHRQMLVKAALLGIDACPAYGRKLIDSGELTASVTTPATTGEAIASLRRFWDSGQILRLKALVEPGPYPASIVAPPS